MIQLVECCKLQGKIDYSIRVCDEIIQGLKTISSREHPLERKMKEQRRELTEMGQNGKAEDVGSKVDIYRSVVRTTKIGTW